jgi:hypothetical protein
LREPLKTSISNSTKYKEATAFQYSFRHPQEGQVTEFLYNQKNIEDLALRAAYRKEHMSKVRVFTAQFSFRLLASYAISV